MTFYDFLRFTFSSFWYFLGVLLLLSTVLNGLANILKSIAMMIQGVPTEKPVISDTDKSANIEDDENTETRFL